MVFLLWFYQETLGDKKGIKKHIWISWYSDSITGLTLEVGITETPEWGGIDMLNKSEINLITYNFN